MARRTSLASTAEGRSNSRRVAVATVDYKDMEQFMKSCVQLYLDLAPRLEPDPVSMPFLGEDGRDAPSRSAAHKGPLEECLRCTHTFPLNPWPDLRAYEASKKSQ